MDVSPLILYQKQLKQQIDASLSKFRILVLKGIPTAILKNIPDVNFIQGLPLENDKISFDLIYKRYKSILTEILDKQLSGILIWEEFVNLSKYVTVNLFEDQVIVLFDNLRSLFPYEGSTGLHETEFIEDDNNNEQLPLGYSEVHNIMDSVFIKYTSTPTGIIESPLFVNKEQISQVKDYNPNIQIIDLDEDDQGLDLFISKILFGSPDVKAYIVKSRKNLHFNSDIQLLEQINIFLTNIGGGLEIVQNSKLTKNVNISAIVEQLLIRYWGIDASFRSMLVYQDPDVDNKIIEISQGEVVQTIINEWYNARNGVPFRDLFLTAPTGSGKSLLFQLPAFYLSELKEITIVVSPLISLMKDQVSAIQNDRKFIKISYLNSELSLLERDFIIKDCKTGNIDILYMSPELLLSYRIEYFIGNRKLGLIVIDEAHLVTTWGRDFRVDYWFLGNHLRKVRKYYNNLFPIVAVTATAVYGGNNDMVFESLDALYLSNPHLFIGSVKRKNIQFYIGNTDLGNKDYQLEKIKQTVKFIEDAVSTGVKTLVYTPYSSQVESIYNLLDEPTKKLTSRYFSSLYKNSKTYNFESFFQGKTRIMIATKAFGMGVDISDIQIVYHHAPSGHLADYVQEIGRIARNPNIMGYSIINYNSKDNHFTKTLHGLSSIKSYQLQEVLKKIYKVQLFANSKNLLLSTDDFAHIFPKSDSDELSQKVMTSLMMIEKDFLHKSRFNVIVARPKKLFVKVFGKIKNTDKEKLLVNYPNAIEEIQHDDISFQGFNLVVLNLDKIWIDKFKDISFAHLKSKFYTGDLFKEIEIKVDPILKLEYFIENDPTFVRNELTTRIQAIKETFTALKEKYFTETELNDKIYEKIKDVDISRSISTFLLSLFSSHASSHSELYDPDAFIQKRLINNEYRYRLFSIKYQKEFSRIRAKYEEIFTPSISNKTHIVRYVISDTRSNLGLIRLGYLLEILKIGTFEVSGGNSPMIFVRINDPNKLKRTAFDTTYENSLLSDVYRRHDISNKIFEHFFLKSLSNIERWNFIEEYFLGSEIDELFRKFPGNSITTTNLEFKPFENLQISSDSKSLGEVKVNKISFPTTNFFPQKGYSYNSGSIITLNISEVISTHKITEWIVINPVELHKAMIKLGFKIEKSPYEILMSVLQARHKTYLDGYLENDRVAIIKIDGHEVNLKVPGWIKSHPIEFYKWWCKNRDKIKITISEKIQLLFRVKDLNQNLLTSEDKLFIKIKTNL